MGSLESGKMAKQRHLYTIISNIFQSSLRAMGPTSNKQNYVTGFINRAPGCFTCMMVIDSQ